jgi:hypothetical protein
VVQLPEGAREFDFSQSGHIASGIRAATFAVDVWWGGGGVKRRRHETDQSTEEYVALLPPTLRL